MKAFLGFTLITVSIIWCLFVMMLDSSNFLSDATVEINAGIALLLLLAGLLLIANHFLSKQK